MSEGLFEVGGRGGGGRSCAGRPIRRDVLHGRPRPLLLTDTSAPGKGLTWVHGVSSHHYAAPKDILVPHGRLLNKFPSKGTSKFK